VRAAPLGPTSLSVHPWNPDPAADSRRRASRYARNLGTDEVPATSVSLARSRRTICHGDGGFSVYYCRGWSQWTSAAPADVQDLD
jgi:hypothetical protein